MTKKIVAIGGVPGTGKTTLIRELMKSYSGDWVRSKPVKLLDTERNLDHNIEVFGKYDEGEVFAGTDRLSMAVQPEASSYLLSNDSFDKIIFEGDRLFNSSFLTSISEMDNVDLSIVILTANSLVLESRYKERGSDQPEKFLKSRETKVERIMSNFSFMPLIEEFENTNQLDQSKIVSHIKNFLES